MEKKILQKKHRLKTWHGAQNSLKLRFPWLFRLEKASLLWSLSCGCGRAAAGAGGISGGGHAFLSVFLSAAWGAGECKGKAEEKRTK